MDATVVCIDQPKKSVQSSRVRRGFPEARDRPPNYPVSVTGRVCWARSPKSVITCSLESRSPSPPSRRNISFLYYTRALENDLVIVLDGAPYFQASALTDLTARDVLGFVTLPAYLSELNPVEERWRQLQAALSNCLLESLDDLTAAIETTLDQLSIPNLGNYF